MMNQLMLVVCTVVGGVLMLEAAYLPAPNVVDAAAPKDGDSVAQRAVQQNFQNDLRAFYTERYSPDVARVLMNPHLMQELYEAVQQPIQVESDYKPSAPAKRAQTFVRFGKRSQTFVRFG